MTYPFANNRISPCSLAAEARQPDRQTTPSNAEEQQNQASDPEKTKGMFKKTKGKWKRAETSDEAQRRDVLRRSARLLSSTDKESLMGAGSLVTTIASSEGHRLFESVMKDMNSVDEDIFNNYDFNFENLIFEGGGNKGLAYVGALEVLEAAGIMQGIKRVAGASVGAITATLVAVGYTSQDMKTFADEDLKNIIVDHKCGFCSFLPNLLEGFGWNPGKGLLKWFGTQLKERTGNADVTFKELLHLSGRELCIVVTNLSQMTVEYFHPKTSPNMPVRLAVRMSMAMPGVFQSVHYRLHDSSDVYVDGGLLCNYPIHAYDGWWLSMQQEDSFFKRLQNLDEFPRLFERSQRFGKWNKKTLGLVLYSFSETELMKMLLISRPGSCAPRPPNTRLYRKRRKVQQKQAETRLEHDSLVNAVSRFMQELHRLSFDLDGVISKDELDKVFEESTIFTPEDKVLLFGDADCSQAFREMDHNQDGDITFQELMAFVEKRGVSLQSRFLGYKRREITGLGDFISALQSCLSVNIKRNYVDERDIDRTIGIDTDYIETNDYVLEDLDKCFLIETGARATRSFLREYTQKHPEQRRRASAMLSKDFFSQSMDLKELIRLEEDIPEEEKEDESVFDDCQTLDANIHNGNAMTEDNLQDFSTARETSFCTPSLPGQDDLECG